MMRGASISVCVLSLLLSAGCGDDASSTSGTGGGGGGSGGGGTGGGSGGGATGPGPKFQGCPVFPADNEWNRDVSSDPVDPNSAAYIAHINGNGSGTKLHPDFGSNPEYGIPYVVVDASTAKVPVTFDYADESDPGPYPIPPDAPIEGGASASGDRHVIAFDKDACKLYELFDSHYQGPGWTAGSGAVFDLKSNALRPEGWTSADAAGLPIFPGLVRYDEAVTAGKIEHALRFTVKTSQKAYIHPATHWASSVTDAAAPPMGLRLRLKASFDLSPYSGPALVVLTALKKYGMIVADNGSNWFISGASHASFDDDQLGQLKQVPGDAFEVVQAGAIVKP
ncbi:MAG: hypothetical protein HYZ29_34930 [Myxococcales bacterium]|nr:hypothetical protein [Myxococcales bacterium]